MLSIFQYPQFRFSSVMGLSAAWIILRILRILRNFVQRLGGFWSLRSAANKARIPLLELVADQLTRRQERVVVEILGPNPQLHICTFARETSHSIGQRWRRGDSVRAPKKFSVVLVKRKSNGINGRFDEKPFFQCHWEICGLEFCPKS